MSFNDMIDDYGFKKKLSMVHVTVETPFGNRLEQSIPYNMLMSKYNGIVSIYDTITMSEKRAQIECRYTDENSPIVFVTTDEDAFIDRFSFGSDSDETHAGDIAEEQKVLSDCILKRTPASISIKPIMYNKQDSLQSILSPLQLKTMDKTLIINLYAFFEGYRGYKDIISRFYDDEVIYDVVSINIANIENYSTKTFDDHKRINSHLSELIHKILAYQDSLDRIIILYDESIKESAKSVVEALHEAILTFINITTCSQYIKQVALARIMENVRADEFKEKLDLILLYLLVAGVDAANELYDSGTSNLTKVAYKYFEKHL